MPLDQSFRGLLSVHSRYGLHARQVAYATLYTGGSDGFVAFTAAPIATGWSEQFPGGTFTRSEPAPFTAHVIWGFNNKYALLIPVSAKRDVSSRIACFLCLTNGTFITQAGSSGTVSPTDLLGKCSIGSHWSSGLKVGSL